MGKSKRSQEEGSSERIENLRGEIRKLRKQVQQLQKDNERLRNRNASIEEIFEDNCEYVEVPKSHEPRCPNCASKDVSIIEKLKAGKDYYICRKCDSRGPLR